MSFIIKSRRPSKPVFNSRVNRALTTYNAAPLGRDRSYDFIREEFIKNHGKNYDSTAQYLFNRLMVKCSALNNPPEHVCLFSSCVQY